MGKDVSGQVNFSDLSDPSLYTDVAAVVNGGLPEGLLALAAAD